MKRLFLIAILTIFTLTTTVAQITIFESKTEQTEDNASSSFMSNSGAETQALPEDNIADVAKTSPIVESLIALLGLGGAYVVRLVRKNRKEK